MQTRGLTQRLTLQSLSRSLRLCSRPSQLQCAAFSTTLRRRELAAPLNIPKWLSENSHLLKPPVNNHLVNNDEMTVQIVGGPNARTDYHINATPEWFYQYKGSMLLKTVDTSAKPSSTIGSPNTLRPSTGGAFKDIHIHEGDIFLLPANVPHNPVRFANTVGVVIEQPRPKDSVDHLRWYCQACGEKVHEKSFYCTDLGTQIKAAVQAFEKDTDARTCRKCGEICDVRPKPKA
ncbi:MAG: 3-hydroxyanthranilic acid dioxygenase [Bathelium mastoideum]|nr:MAG: 3-hydroxyanthranilic acid dioxygenase [Bathelium mastoideum]